MFPNFKNPQLFVDKGNVNKSFDSKTLNLPIHNLYNVS